MKLPHAVTLFSLLLVCHDLLVILDTHWLGESSPCILEQTLSLKEGLFYGI